MNYRKRAISTRGTIKSRRIFGPVFFSKFWGFSMGTIQERVLIAHLQYFEKIVCNLSLQ